MKTTTMKKERSESAFGFKVDLWKYEGELGALIPLLQSAQDTYGYIPESAIDHISEIVGIAPAEIYGVITFYSQFRLQPLGKYVLKVCDGTACHVNNSKTLITTIQDSLNITNNETTEDGMFTLQTVACLGCCSLAPAVMINDETYGKLDSKKMRKLIKEYQRKEKQDAVKQAEPAEA